MALSIQQLVQDIQDCGQDENMYYSYEEDRILDSWEEPGDDAIPLPNKDEIGEYDIMTSFAESRTDEQQKSWLVNALTGKGAFRRFRAVLERFRITMDWYDFRDQEYARILRTWCEDNGIEYRDDLPVRKPANTAVNKPEPVSRYTLRTVREETAVNLVYMVSDLYRYELNLNGVEVKEDLEQADEIIRRELQASHTVYAMLDHGRYMAYAVFARQDEGVVLRQLYVRPEYRRKGIGRQLIQEGEKLGGPLSVPVQLGNRLMLEFLQAVGYGKTEQIVKVKGSDPQPAH